MGTTRTVFGVADFKKKLDKTIKKFEKGSEENVVVGFVQTYSLPVHELHKTQSKFLEQPFRTGMPIITSIVDREMQKHGNLTQSMLKAGEWLKQSAQAVTPVDTGALKGSAFVTTESKEDEVAEQSFKRSEAIRIAAGK